MLYCHPMMERLGDYLSKRDLPGDKELSDKLKSHATETGDVSLEDFFGEGQSRALVPVKPPSVGGQLVIPTGEGHMGAGEFQFAEHTPELMHSLYSRFWEMAGERIHRTIRVPKPKFSLVELTTAERNGLFFVYIPPRYARPEALPELATIFPWAQGELITSTQNYVINQSTGSGWLTVEWTGGLPFMGKKEYTSILNEMGREGQTLNTYIVGTAVHKLLTNKFWDEGSYSVLPGSQVTTSDMKTPESEPVVVTCLAGGAIHMSNLQELTINRRIPANTSIRTQSPRVVYPGVSVSVEAFSNPISMLNAQIMDGLGKIFGR